MPQINFLFICFYINLDLLFRTIVADILWNNDY